MPDSQIIIHPNVCIEHHTERNFSRINICGKEDERLHPKFFVLKRNAPTHALPRRLCLRGRIYAGGHILKFSSLLISKMSCIALSQILAWMDPKFSIFVVRHSPLTPPSSRKEGNFCPFCSLSDLGGWTKWLCKGIFSTAEIRFPIGQQLPLPA